jgi:hypothetical protein
MAASAGWPGPTGSRSSAIVSSGPRGGGVILQQLDGVEDAAARAADRIDPAAEHHLRCIHPRLPEPVGIALLPLSACPRARARPASRGDPDRSREALRQDVVAPDKLSTSRSAGGQDWNLGGEQLDRGRRHSVMASSIRKKSGGEKPRHRHEWSHWMLSRTSRVGPMSQACESQGCEGDRLKRDKAMCTQLFFPAFQVRLRLS